MTILPIVDVGHPTLRERAREVTPAELASPGFQRFVDDLIETMRDAGGAGLAANQVGDTRRVAVVEVVQPHPRYPYKPPIPLTVIVNPTLRLVGEERFTNNEGCLSVPDLRGDLERAVTVRVRWTDREGVAHDEERRGLTAGTFQHEVDHLEGIMFLDRVTDPTTFSTWAEFDAHRRADYVARAEALVERVGS